MPYTPEKEREYLAGVLASALNMISVVAHAEPDNNLADMLSGSKRLLTERVKDYAYEKKFSAFDPNELALALLVEMEKIFKDKR